MSCVHEKLGRSCSKQKKKKYQSVTCLHQNPLRSNRRNWFGNKSVPQSFSALLGQTIISISLAWARHKAGHILWSADFWPLGADHTSNVPWPQKSDVPWSAPFWPIDKDDKNSPTITPILGDESLLSGHDSCIKVRRTPESMKTWTRDWKPERVNASRSSQTLLGPGPTRKNGFAGDRADLLLSFSLVLCHRQLSVRGRK